MSNFYIFQLIFLSDVLKLFIFDSKLLVSVQMFTFCNRTVYIITFMCVLAGKSYFFLQSQLITAMTCFFLI